MSRIILKKTSHDAIILGPGQEVHSYSVQPILPDENEDKSGQPQANTWQLKRIDSATRIEIIIGDYDSEKGARKALKYILASYKKQNGTRIPAGVLYGVAGLLFGIAISVGLSHHGQRLPQNYANQMNMIGMTTPSDGDPMGGPMDGNFDMKKMAGSPDNAALLNKFVGNIGKMPIAPETTPDVKSLASSTADKRPSTKPDSLRTGDIVEVDKPVEIPESKDDSAKGDDNTSSSIAPQTQAIETAKTKLDALHGVQDIIPGSDFGDYNSLSKVMPDVSQKETPKK